MRSLAAIALSLALLAPACVGSHWMRGHAFVPPMRHYRIRYDDDAHRAVLPRGWRVVNHDGAGVRLGDAWWSRDAVEVSAGTSHLVPRPRFDLYAERDDDGAILFVRTIPVPFRIGARPLADFAHHFVLRARDEGLTFVDGARTVRPGAATIQSESPAEVGGVEAYAITVDASVAAAARHESPRTVALVLFRPGAWRWRESGLATAEGAPMLVVAGYAASPDDYDAHVADFHALLGRLDVRPDAP
jgi:hypothetical protein